MVGDTDKKDKDDSRRIAIALIVLVVLLVVAAALILPLAAELAATHLAPGLGMRDAAVISFFLTLLIMVVFAITSGDGLLGELQFMLVGFLAFFVILWLLIAWVF